MRILDLFCGAGGAASGYAQAFPGAEIVGVDVARQPRYPYEFVQADAMTYPLDGFDLIHASPPCQDWSTLKTMHSGHGTAHMLPDTIARLRAHGTPWVVENVPGSGRGMGGSFVTLCGSSFGLGVRRHRNFASSFLVLGLPCRHDQQGVPVGVYGHPGGSSTRDSTTKALTAEWRQAMGIDWMTARELAQAIPPAYTAWIGTMFTATLEYAA